MVRSVAKFHELGVAHNDVKAENFLCVRENVNDDDYRVVLADYGFAMGPKKVEENATV